jgi:ketosteroid isomerase-like protein
MSEENANKVRAAFEAWSRGDWDAALKDTAPEFVFDNSTALDEWRGVHRGHDAVRRMMQSFTEPWERVEIEVVEVVEARDDLVVTTNRARMFGRDGIEVPGPTQDGWVWRFRQGRAVHLGYYNSLEDALGAVGLQE